jgi:hypothetical protein
MREGMSRLVLGLVLGVVLGALGGRFLLGGGESQVLGAAEPLEAVDRGPVRPEAAAPSRELAQAAPSAAGVRTEAPTTPVPVEVSEAEVQRLVDGVTAMDASGEVGQGAVTGRVTGPDGAGLAGALVRVVRVTSSASRSSSLGSGPPVQDDLEEVVRRAVERHVRERSNTYEALSGADGSYRVAGLPEANWRVAAYLEGYALEAVGDTYDIPTGSVVDYHAAPVLEVPVRIVGTGGRSVSEADLVLERHLGGHTREETVRWSADEPTVRMLPGRYEVRAVAGLREDRGSEPVSITLEAGERPEELLLTLRDRLGIRGRVLDGPGERVEGQSMMARLLPLAPGQELDLERLGNADRTEWVRSSRTFAFLDLEPGTYAVGASWGWSAPVAVHQVVEVVDGIVELDLQLPSIDEQEFLRVRVLDGQGANVPGVNFQFRHERGGGSSSSGLQPLTTASGEYLLSVPRGTREAYFAGTEGHSFQLQVTAGSTGAATVDLAAGQLDLTVSLATPARLEVTVAGYGGSGYEGRLDVSASPVGGRTTFSRGEALSAEGVKLIEGLEPGDYRVVLRLRPKGEGSFGWGKEIAATDLTLVPGENLATLAIPSLHSFRVLSGDAKEGANLSLRAVGDASDFTSYHRTEFDADGVALFEEIPAGDYVLSGSFAGGSTMEIRVPTGDVTYEPKPVNALRVTIRDEAGDLHRIGLRTGDLVIGRDGREFEDMKDLQGLQVLMQSKSAEFELMVQRGSQVLTFPVKGSDIGDWQTFGGDLDPAGH